MSPAPLALFRDGAYRALWLSGAAASTTRWLEMLAVGVFVFEVSGSPFLVALFTVLRMLPLALFGILTGALAERYDRLRMQSFGLAAMTAISLLLAGLAWSGRIELWHIAIGVALGGLFWTADMPARRTLMGEIAGSERMATAMALDSVTNNGTRLLGPLLGGLLLEAIGLDGMFLLSALFYALGFVAIARAPLSDTRQGGGELGRMFSRIVEGLRYARSNRALVGTLAVTVVFNLWGFPFTAMVPVIGIEVLQLSAFPVGVLASMEGAGAFLGAIVIAFFAQPRSYHKLYLYGVLLYLSAALVFACSPWVSVSAAALLVTGFAVAAFSTMQSTLVFLAAPPEVRQRIMGLLSVCIGTGPLGFLHLGLLANWLGAPWAVVIIAAEGLIALALTVWWWPEIRGR